MAHFLTTADPRDQFLQPIFSQHVLAGNGLQEPIQNRQQSRGDVDISAPWLGDKLRVFWAPLLPGQALRNGEKRSLVAGFFTNPSEQKICRVRQIGGCFTPRFGMNIAFSFLKPPDRRNHDFPCRFWYGQSFASRVKTSMSLSYLDFDLHFRKLQGSVKGLVKVFV